MNKEQRQMKQDEKAQRAYGLVVIKEDAEKGFSKKFIDTQKINQYVTLLVAVGAVVLCVLVFCVIRMVTLYSSVEKLQSELTDTKTTMSSQVVTLQNENEDLGSKVKILSDQMNLEIKKDQEQAEQRVPTGLPVSGKVSIIAENALAEPEDEEDDKAGKDKKDNSEQLSKEESSNPQDEEEQEYLTIFGVSRGSIVMAAGNGKVSAINEDTTYGTAVWIDHGNGYQTVYYYDGKPKVKEKDEVLRGTLLFEVEQNNRRVGYQIIRDGYYIDPLNLMAISG